MSGKKAEDQVTTQTQDTNSTSTTTPSMPQWADQYAKQTANLGRKSAQQWATDAIDPLQIAGFNTDQTGAFDMARGFGQSNPYQTALGTLTGTASGDFLYGGAAQDAFVNAAARGAMPGIMSSFGSAGRGGGQLSKLQLGQVMGDSYAGLYNQERDRQMAAAGALPGMAQIPMNLLMGIGNQQQENQQSIYSAAKTAQDQERARDAEIAKYAANAIPFSSVTGTTTTSSGSSTGQTIVPQYENQTAQMLGGAIGGAQVGAQIGGPYGAAVGGIIGGSAPYFG